MNKFLIVILVSCITFNISYGYQWQFWPIQPQELRILTWWDNTCKPWSYEESDVPTIFVPWIAASWYSEQWHTESKQKRWIPDPVTHVYDPLFFAFKRQWYTIEDVFYRDEFNLDIDGNPKKSLYLFWYDWKKDNKITATLLTQLIGKILLEYEEYNGCNIGKVNIIGHSMWWLVARAMLEDMCVEYGDDDFNGNKVILDYNASNERNWELQLFPSKLCTNPYPTESTGTKIKVHKFVTIATPHRGSPKSLALWERWDIELTDGLAFGKVIKSQLTSFLGTDQNLYQLIHWYSEKIPNGIVTLWQLLPDIESETTYNTKLEYLDKPDLIKTYEIKKNNYPKNSFLEELNRKENISKIWGKIDKYISYYSLKTWQSWKNNIIWYNLRWNDYRSQLGTPIKTNFTPWDITETLAGRDIYDYYKWDLNYKEYNISETILNDSWSWWDGTVPSKNLRLVPNNDLSSQEIEHSKFESKEIKCYDDSLSSYDNPIYENIWLNTEYEICSHTNMPIATIPEVIDFITWHTTEDKRGKILRNLWYTRYLEVPKKEIWAIDILNRWIHNYTALDEYFEEDYFMPSQTVIENWIYKNSLDLWDISLKSFRVARYDILSPINLLITDDQWRSIWIDPDTGRIINEIPGAWTSWNTEWSWEPEFFLIPLSWTGATNHQIKTYGTWDGEYHIVMNEIETNPPPSPLPSKEGEENSWWTTEESKGFIIAWTAKTNFWEDYEVEIAETGAEYVNLTETTPPTLEVSPTPSPLERVGVRSLTTDQRNLDIRYTIRWNSENVQKMKYTLMPLSPLGGKAGIGGTTTITWKLTLNLPQETTYTIELQLLDQNNEPLTNPESKQTIKITKIKKQATIVERIKQNSNNQNASSLTLDEEQREELLSFTYKKETSLNLQIKTTQVQEGPLWYQLTHNYDTPENQDEDLEYIYKKNDRWEDILDYVTDNETNTLFFEYQDDFIKQIKDLYNNIFTFEYTIIENIPFLTDIKIQNTTSLKPVQNIQIEYSEDLEPQVDVDTIELQTMPHNNSPSLLGRGLGGGLIQYFQWQDGNLYSTLWNKIYQINKKTKKRKLIFISLSYPKGHFTREYPKGEGLSNIFVTKQWTLYFTDTNNILHKYTNKKLFTYDLQIPWNFIIKQWKVYFLDPFKKQYNIYDLETQKLQKVDTKIFYTGIGIKNDGIIFTDESNESKNNQDHPEFEMKYEKKLQKLQEKLQFGYTIEVKEKLRRAIEKSKTKFLMRIKDEYLKTEMNYLIDRILDLLW